MSITVKSLFSLVFGIYLGIGSSLAIAALIVSSKDGHNTCIASYEGINFSYATYLNVFGWVTVATSVINFIIFTTGVCLDNLEIFSSLLGCLNALLGMFDFTWYIVGAVLYFKEVDRTCNSDDMIRQFGLALFIIKTVLWAIACCGGGSSQNSQNNQNNNDNAYRV